MRREKMKQFAAPSAESCPMHWRRHCGDRLESRYQLDSRRAYAQGVLKITVLHDNNEDRAFATAVRAILKAGSHHQVYPLELVADSVPDQLGHFSRLLVLTSLGRPELSRQVDAIRANNPNVGLLVVSTSLDPGTAIACLEAGADDFVRVPFDARELLSRVAAVGRRLGLARHGCDWNFDQTAFCARFGDQRFVFKKTSFAIFQYLCERVGSWVTTETLREDVLKIHCHPGASNVRWHIHQVRESLGPLAWTVHGDIRRGYMFWTKGCGLSHCTKPARATAQDF